MPEGPQERRRSGWEARSYWSFARFLRTVAERGSGSKLIDRDGIVACVCPATPERSLFNAVLYRDPEQLERALPWLSSAYAEAAVRVWTVWVPAADQHGSKLLAERGHRLDGEPHRVPP